MAKLFYVGIKALINNSEGNILLLKASTRDHSKNTQPYWDIPGGRIEEGANVDDTLLREIEEETGITDVSGIEFLTAVISHHQIPIDDNRTAGLVLMVYMASIPDDVEIVLSPEHTEFEWVLPQEAAERLSNKYPQAFTDSLK